MNFQRLKNHQNPTYMAFNARNRLKARRDNLLKVIE